MNKVVAIGAGRMGRGIAQVFAFAGHKVSIIDFKDRTSEQTKYLFKESREEIFQNLTLLSSIGLISPELIDSTMDRIELHALSNSKDIILDADYIFEAVPEVVEIKERVFKKLDSLMTPDVIFASTTSTILSNKLAKFVTTPKNFLNAHFLNPAYLVPLVEISPCEETDPKIVDKFCLFLKSIGKVPVVCKSSPGYIVPRLQSLLMSEACRMVEEGVASAEDIDKAVKNGLGIRFTSMGPLEFVDWGGLDILYYANKYLSDNLGERFSTPEIVDKNMEKGNIGIKSGKGIYDFSAINIEEYKEEKLSNFGELLKHLRLLPKSA